MIAPAGRYILRLRYHDRQVGSRDPVPCGGMWAQPVQDQFYWSLAGQHYHPLGHHETTDETPASTPAHVPFSVWTTSRHSVQQQWSCEHGYCLMSDPLIV